MRVRRGDSRRTCHAETLGPEGQPGFIAFSRVPPGVPRAGLLRHVAGARIQAAARRLGVEDYARLARQDAPGGREGVRRILGVVQGAAARPSDSREAREQR
jgi:hypothetical protein